MSWVVEIKFSWMNTRKSVFVIGFLVVIVLLSSWWSSFSLTTSSSGPSRLSKAVMAGDHEYVEKLLRLGVNPDDAGKDIISPLGRAILKNDLLSAEMLLAAGASLNKEVSWRTPLGLAAGSSSVAMTKLLLKSGADPNGTNQNGSTAIMFAARSSTTSSMAILVEAGANVNITNKFGYSPILEAMASGSYENALWLIDHGANLSVTNINGMHPLQFLHGPALVRKDADALRELRKRFVGP